MMGTIRGESGYVYGIPQRLRLRLQKLLQVLLNQAGYFMLEPMLLPPTCIGGVLDLRDSCLILFSLPETHTRRSILANLVKPSSRSPHRYVVGSPLINNLIAVFAHHWNATVDGPARCRSSSRL
jgi:hypothetical protein